VERLIGNSVRSTAQARSERLEAAILVTTDGRLVGLRPRFRFKSYEINHLPKNNARTEVLEEWCENGGLDAFDGDRRDTFMTRCLVLVRFDH